MIYLMLIFIHVIKLKSLKLNILKQLNTIASGVGDHFSLIYKSYYVNLTSRADIAKTPIEREFIVMPFCCKFIDRLGFQSIFRDSSVESLLRPSLKDFLPLKVYYKYNNPIGRKLFNYGSFLKDLNTSQIQEILK